MEDIAGIFKTYRRSAQFRSVRVFIVAANRFKLMIFVVGPLEHNLNLFRTCIICADNCINNLFDLKREETNRKVIF